MSRHQPADLLLHHAQHLVTQVWLAEHLPSLSVDNLTLLVDHIVELQHVLADVEVIPLHPCLRRPDSLIEPGMLDGHVILHAKPVHQFLDSFAAEAAHQLIF